MIPNNEEVNKLFKDYAPLVNGVQVSPKIWRCVSGSKSKAKQKLILKQFFINEKNPDERKSKIDSAEEEYKTMKSLSARSSIVQVYCKGRFEKDGNVYFYILMEDAGESLKNWIDSHAKEVTPLKERLSILAKVGKALLDLKAESCLHGDIKPANICYDADQVKLIDFGTTSISGETTYMKERAGNICI